MNCNYFEERVSDYLENTLSGPERLVMEEHLSSCPACSELLEGVRQVMLWRNELSDHTPSPWLASRIVANTPQVIRITWRDWFVNAWRSVSEPRFALGLLTSVLMLAWMGNVVGISASDLAMVRHPSAIYNRMEGWANRVYGDAIRSYYSSPLVNTIQCQIHRRIEQYRENS